MRDVRLVATDLDRTLITTSGDLPPHFGEDLKGLRDSGIVFVPASGRPLPTLMKLFPPIGESIGYVADNGGVVALGGKVLQTSLIPRPKYTEMIDTAMREGTGVPTLCAVDHTYVSEADIQHQDYLSEFFYDLTFVPDLRELDVDATKFSIGFPSGGSREHRDSLYLPRYGAEYSVVVAGPGWVDIMNRGVDKGHGLRILGKHLGISSAQMMAFGDTDNDLAMLSEVKYSYAVANADPHVIERATYQTLSNDEFGVSAVIGELIRKVN